MRPASFHIRARAWSIARRMHRFSQRQLQRDAALPASIATGLIGWWERSGLVERRDIPFVAADGTQGVSTIYRMSWLADASPRLPGERPDGSGEPTAPQRPARASHRQRLWIAARVLRTFDTAAVAAAAMVPERIAARILNEFRRAGALRLTRPATGGRHAKYRVISAQPTPPMPKAAKAGGAT